MNTSDSRLAKGYNALLFATLMYVQQIEKLKCRFSKINSTKIKEGKFVIFMCNLLRNIKINGIKCHCKHWRQTKSEQVKIIK